MSLVVSVDLRAQFGPVRDQGDRPTCLAFAASDAHAALRPAWTPLSCEFAFYYAQRRGGRSPSRGALLSLMLATLKEDGQPVEADWPYLEALPDDLDDYGPPLAVIVFRRNGELRPSGIAEIIAQLDAGRPALVLLMLSSSFDLAGPDGIVQAPAAEAPDRTRRHAMVAVGHGTLNGAPAILVRNSWGDGWGQAGHGWLSEAYLAPRLTAVALLMENIDVPAKDLAA
jgi:hypothetical protein